MAEFHVAVIPVGKIDSAEIEATLVRVAKGARSPVELRGSLPVPQGIKESERGQFRASKMMERLRSMVAQLGAGKSIGADGDKGEKPPLKADAFIFVTDVDLYTANSDAVFSALMSSRGLAVVSLKRLREAFYRRSADPVKQRARLVKEMLRMFGRLRGAPECPRPQCALSASKMFADLDLKEERYCRDCSQRLFEGKIRI